MRLMKLHYNYRSILSTVFTGVLFNISWRHIAVNRTPLAVSARQAKTWHVMHFIHYVAGELSDLCVVTACFARSARESVVVVV